MKQIKKKKVLVDAKERQRRMLESFDAAIMNPDPDALVVFFRVGLRPWQRESGAKFNNEQLLAIVDKLGLEKLRLMHMTALATGCYMTGEEVEADEGKAASGASASST